MDDRAQEKVKERIDSARGWHELAFRECIEEAAGMKKHLAAARPRLEKLEKLLTNALSDSEESRMIGQREKQLFIQGVTERLALQMLPVLDNLDRAHRSLAQGNDLASLKTGIELIHQQLQDELTRLGLAPVEASQMFDPELHEAVAQRPSAKPKGAILEIHEKGYRMGAKVIRHARVVVSSGSENQNGVSANR